MRKLLIIATIAILSLPAHAKDRRFECKELRGLSHLSRAYHDTLEACIWDFRHPIKKR